VLNSRQHIIACDDKLPERDLPFGLIVICTMEQHFEYGVSRARDNF